MNAWQRRRAPEDVPTPIAVALSDYCRRAQAPASPKAVRDALSCLEDAEDGGLKALADGEPQARPLGPFAVVEVFRGLSPEVAASRERAGEYRGVSASLPKFGEAPPPSAPAPRASASRPPPSTPTPKRKKARAADAPKKLSKAERLAERIQPKRRRPGDAVRPPPPPVALPGTAFLPKRSLPAPRGRFTTIDASRQSMDVLLKVTAKDAVEAIEQQCATRYAVWSALSASYTGRKGQPLQLPDVAAILERHGLMSGLLRREAEGVLAHLTDQRGWLSRAAGALGVNRGQLEELIVDLGLERQAREIRQRFAREALAGGNLSSRLELLGKGKYLADLDIEADFFAALKRDLERLMADDAAEPVGVRVERAAKRHGLSAELLRRAVSRLELT